MGAVRRVSNRISAIRKSSGWSGVARTIGSYALWRLKGRPVSGDTPTYREWLTTYGDIGPDGEVDNGTRFSIVCPVYNTPVELLRQTIDSVGRQTFENWELILVDDASNHQDTVAILEQLGAGDPRIRVLSLTENGGISRATNKGIEAATGSYLVFLDHDDVLAATALEWLATCTPQADLIYTDEDKIDIEGSHFEPFFKPAWSPRLLLGVNYLNHITCVKTDLVKKLGGLRPEFDGAQDHDLLLRLAELPLTVAHIPHVLYHWRAWEQSVAGAPSSKVAVEAQGIRAVQEAIDRRGWGAEAAIGNGSPFNYRVYWRRQPDPATVKIVMPTRDRVDLLRNALEGIFSRTDGVDVHVVVVDNGSKEMQTLEFLWEIDDSWDNVTVKRVDDAFNYSKLCNEGVETGPDTKMVLFLNNDVEILHRNWLLQLSGWLRDPEIVGVGPKLHFPDRTIQHGGVILGLGGIAGHYAGYLPDEPQTSNLHDQAREVGCLTAASLLVRTSDYQTVGGMNEHLAIDFQDVDLCLRLRTELGGWLMYDPTYPLIHQQSASRGDYGAPSGYTIARMRFLWGSELAKGDPFYNPHLTLTQHDFSLAPLPNLEPKRLRRLEPRVTHSNPGLSP